MLPRSAAACRLARRFKVAIEMFLRLVADSFTRRPRHKLLTGAALALGMAVATAALSVSLDVGDRLSREFRSLGANLVVSPQADSLPLEIGGVDYRPVNAGAYLPESDLRKLKAIFWHNNIVAFAPLLEVRADFGLPGKQSAEFVAKGQAQLIGTWAVHSLPLPDGTSFTTGVGQTNPWWQLQGRWFADVANECVLGTKFAQRSNLGIGDQLFVNVPDSSRPDSSKPDSAKVVQTFASCSITGILTTGAGEDQSILMPLAAVQKLAQKPAQYRRLYVSALTKPEDDFGRRDPATMKPDELERWSCSPYVSSIAYSIKQALPGSDVRVIRRVAEGEGSILTRVRTLLWLVTFAALLAAALAVGASSAASVIERRTEIGLMKALGAGSGTVGLLLAAEQLLLAIVGGGVGYALGIVLARVVGEKIFGAAPEPSFLLLFVILGLATAVTVLGSAIPLRRASRYEPAPILRGE
jgi:putative ABC transport system permease protein